MNYMFNLCSPKLETSDLKSKLVDPVQAKLDFNGMGGHYRNVINWLELNPGPRMLEVSNIRLDNRRASIQLIVIYVILGLNPACSRNAGGTLTGPL